MRSSTTPRRRASARSSPRRRLAPARSSRRRWCSSPRWRSRRAGGRAGEDRQGARPRTATRAAAVVAQADGRGQGLPARPSAVDSHRRLGGVGGRGAAHRGHVVEQRAVGVMAHGGDHRDRAHRDGATQGLVAEGQQVRLGSAPAGDDHHLHLGHRGQVRERPADGRRGVAILDGGEGPHQPPPPAAALQRRQHVVAGLAALAGDHADDARQQRPGQLLLALSRPSERSCRRRRSMRASRSPSPATRRSCTEKENPGEALALPG